MKPKILVVDDSSDIVLMLTDRLEASGYTVLAAGDGQQALDLIETENPRLILLDLQMPKMSGLEVLHRLGDQQKLACGEGNSTEFVEITMPPVVVMTAHGTIAKAVEAMKCGAYDFLTKPLDMDHLMLVIEKALERDTLKREVAYLRHEVASRYNTIIANTSQMQTLIELAQRAANSDATVLLLGESGTGKELFARSIHQWSPRRNNPFVIINCVALTDTLLENELFGHEKGAFTGAHALQKGKIEIADGGTVFLDEIGDMNPDLQAKLLRLLQDHEFHRVGGTKFVRVNIRVIAATNRDLLQAVRNGAFREDLYYRLNVVSLSIPPLRERREDIPALANLSLQRHAREMGKTGMTLSPEAIQVMQQYPWPGNVRELDNAIARAVVLGTGSVIRVEQLGLGSGAETKVVDPEFLGYHEALEHYSRQLLEKALHRANGNQTRAAELLKLQRTYLARLLRQKQIEH
ncbi:MAG: sigma-54-dependent Fis family transcriptional regulator [Nitrospirae bacterium]|nr:MAG: sigma-54-dependent Fis family transcriptional regulator [Nitrospirota bacterium]